MKTRFVSAVAVLICCAIFAIVCAFAYSRYKAGQAANAAFRSELQNGALGQQASLGAQMPPQLPPGAGSAAGQASAAPRP